MTKLFEMMEVVRSLGVAPSTASIIAGLLSGKVNPANFRSVEFWFASTLEVPPNHRKVLSAIAELLNKQEKDIKVTTDKEGEEMWYLQGFANQPTVIWYKGEFRLEEINI